jgi:sec-independent protein translocase protein TatA
MGLPNIGPLELIIILAIALLVVGPKRLPEMGNAFGRTIREFRKASSDFTDATSVTPEAKPSPPPQPNTLSGQAVPNAMPKVEPDGAAEPAPDDDGDASRQA